MDSIQRPLAAPKCYTTHPSLSLGDFAVYGGSCINPVVQDADVYVGLDDGMRVHKESFPWNSGNAFLYHIRNMGIPTTPKRYRRMIEWLVDQITSGSKVHIGCIGGHGRTGLVLVSLVFHLLDEQDAIGYVRKHYCSKAVETQKQIDWLVKEYGIKPQSPRWHDRTPSANTESDTSYWPSYIPRRIEPPFRY
jgi:hypothetical protein